MDWLRAVDAYCERVGPAFWAEPVNAVSNLAFLVAAGLALARGRGARDGAVLALAGLVALIGIGSFLFHTFANRLTALADIVPIAVFIHAYFLLAMRRFFALGPVSAVAATAAFVVLGLAVSAALPPDFLNRSGGYLPAWAAMLTVGAGLVAAGEGEAGRAVLAAGAAFTLSLAARAGDMAVCGAFPLGLHFLWHVLNAAVLALLLLAALEHRRRRP